MIKKIFLRTLEKYPSRWIVLFIDILLSCLSFITAHIIGNDNFNFENLRGQIILVIVVSLISFLTVGSYKGIVRHTGTRDAFNIFVGTSILSLALIFLVSINRFFNIFLSFIIPFSIIIIHYLLTNFILIISRFIFKSFYEIISAELKTITTILIYGAGDAGLITYGVLNRDKNNYEVVGFIDDNQNKVGKRINQTKIYNIEQITLNFIKQKHIDEVIISSQNIKPNRILEISSKLLELGLEVKIVPPISKWIGGNLQANQIRQIKIEDLLNRKPILIDNPIVQRDVNNKTVLVTGAAGSIGSEISKQISLYNHKHLVLVDQAESALYELQQDLLQNKTKNFICIVADICDIVRMEEIFSHFKPDKVFHVAAYKHVPLMEESPYEAVKVNIEGTKNITNLSIKHNIERFVMVSTDKAVNPTNVMGATKRVAEMYIGCLSKKNTTTKFTITRFGNVLDSSGSVIPLFKKQIDNGGPLTLTHKDITRYFMTIPEASRLVLEAGTMGKGGEIYIFDMGKSIKIFDIAKRMIHLSGLKYPDDIDIKIIGLRPGEKLYEELLTSGEDAQQTYHEKILIAKNQSIDVEIVSKKIENVCIENRKNKNKITVKLIKEIVTEYKSNNSEYEKLD